MCDCVCSIEIGQHLESKSILSETVSFLLSRNNFSCLCIVFDAKANEIRDVLIAPIMDGFSFKIG